MVAESQKHIIPRESDPNDPARLAESYAVGLADDLAVYNLWMLKIIRAHVSAGRLADAEYLVTRLPGYGSAMAHAELALHYARIKNAELSEVHLIPAIKLADQISGMPSEMIRTDCVMALYLLGKGKETGNLVNRLGNLSLLILETRLHEEGLMEPISLLMAKRRLVQVPDKGEDEIRARYVLACAEQHFEKGDSEEGVRFLNEIGQMSVQNGLPNAQRVLVDLARIAWMGGQQKMARKSLNLFLKCCEAYGDGADWKPIFIADAVELLISWNEKEEAKEWLKLGEQSIKKVFVLDAPAAFIALAKQREVLNGAESADLFVELAVQAGRSYKHPRVLAEASVRACLYYSENGRKLPSKLLQILSQDSGGEGQ